eukprot:jgi/Phyca11/14513/fgenesh1_pg.PHYCAscaffold_8_\
MTDIADQSIEDLNSKLSGFVDKALGFGFLEEQVKGQLIKLRNPVQFRTAFSTDSSFYFIDNTSSAMDIMRFNIAAQPTPKIDCQVEGKFSLTSQASQDQKELCFFFKRVIVKRSIPVPEFRELIFVQNNNGGKDSAVPTALHSFITEKVDDSRALFDY